MVWGFTALTFFFHRMTLNDLLNKANPLCLVKRFLDIL